MLKKLSESRRENDAGNRACLKKGRGKAVGIKGSNRASLGAEEKHEKVENRLELKQTPKKKKKKKKV